MIEEIDRCLNCIADMGERVDGENFALNFIKNKINLCISKTYQLFVGKMLLQLRSLVEQKDYGDENIYIMSRECDACRFMT